MLRPGLIALVCALAAIPAGLSTSAAAAAAPSSASSAKRVLLVFLPARDRVKTVVPIKNGVEAPKKASSSDVVLTRLGNRPALSIGVSSATQSTYTFTQALLDMTQGTRTSASTYDTREPFTMKLVQTGSRGTIDAWADTVRRAKSAPAPIKPGLLASAIPGGAAYIGYTPSRTKNYEAFVAADRGGNISYVSIGSPETVADRAQAALQRKRFVVAGLPPKRLGGRQLDQLIRARTPDELLIVMQTPPKLKGPQLLPMGIAGLPGKRSLLTSATTRRDGIVAGIDITPTVLDWLGLPVSKDVVGEPIVNSGKTVDVDAIRKLKERFTGIGKRRIPALQGMVLAWLAVFLFLGIIGGFHRMRRRSLRIGALAFLWIPFMVLLPAVLMPYRAYTEMALLAGGCFLAAIATDRLVPWPRGPVVPMVFGLAATLIDLANDSEFIVRSLLGPNPRFGSRFYGIGNEMEAALPVLLFIGLAAYFSGREKSKKLAAIFGACGFALAIMIGWGRLGADVGGVITVGVGTVVIVLMLLPGKLTWQRVALVVVTPVLAVGLLAGLDLVTGGNSHFVRNVINNESGTSIFETLYRRSELAVTSSLRGRMPFIALAGALAILFGYRNRKWLLAPIHGDPVWKAAIVGSLAACIAGSFANDSGALLFVVGCFALGAVTAYVQGDPRLAAAAGGEKLRGGLMGDAVEPPPPEGGGREPAPPEPEAGGEAPAPEPAASAANGAAESDGPASEPTEPAGAR